MTVFFLQTAEGGENDNTNITRGITLEGITYDFNFRWNTRDESWTIAIGLVGSDPLFRVKVTTNRVFNSQYKHLVNAPQGNLMVADIAGGFGRIDFEDFAIDRRYRLLYVESGDL